MPRRFLPKPAPGVDYTITGNTTGFSSEPWALLRNLGLNIGVQQARTENRIPSPVSRAYVFYSNLHGVAFGTASTAADGDDEKLATQGRGALQAEARRAFRGMLTAFALRDAVGLRVALENVYIQPQQDALSDVLRAALTSAPGGEAFWNPMRILKASTPDGRTAVIGGLSPLTGFFPAASPAPALRSLYWYDPDYTAATGAQPVGRWYDPTSGDVSEIQQIQIAPATTMRVRALMGAWVSHILAEWRRQPQLLSTCGLSSRDESALKREVEVWLRDIGPMPGGDLPEPRSASVGDAQDPSVPFFLNWTIGGPDERIASDFSMTPDGRAIVTLDDLQRPRLRLFGRQFGSLGLEAAGEHLRAQGANLGRDLGLGETAVPVPYVCLDRLFTPRLTVLATSEFSPEWSGMAIDEQGAMVYGLFPFEPEILTVLTRAQVEQTTARMGQDSQSYFVTLPLGGGASVTKRYSVNRGGDYVLDDTILLDQYDLRLFPSVDLRKLRHHLPSLTGGQVPDDVYYARSRRLPGWNFRTTAIDAHGRAIGNESVVGSESVPSGADRAPGKASFFEIRGVHPDGFSLQDRGLCFLRLKDPGVDGRQTEEWIVGVDFGTSNTCLSYAPSEGGKVTGEPDVLALPVFTTTLLGTPNYTNVSDGVVDEGASAVLDFFTRIRDRDTLNPDGYFPSQMLTQQPRVSELDGFQLSNGVAFFENLCLTDTDFLTLVHPYPAFTSASGQPKLAKKFTLKRDIKWTEHTWLRAYLQNLRKQITLAAAVRGARVVEVRFSYPRSFGYSKWNTYLADFRRAWSDGVAGQEDLSVRIREMTESEASQGQIVSGTHGYVVFDVGGGTTDVTGYSTKSPVFQTSFRLAAGAVNRYVTASVPLRIRIIDALRNSQPKTYDLLASKQGPRGGWFTAPVGTGETSAEVIETLWLAVLQSLEREGGLQGVLTHLRNSVTGNTPEDQAVKGFFLTSALLFGGIAYLGGSLMGLAGTGFFEEGSEGAPKAIAIPSIQLEMTGNGSKLYRMLGDGDTFSFSDVFVRLFQSGYRRAGAGGEAPPTSFNGLYRVGDAVAPKMSVALGLLKSTPGKASHIPVANVVAEEQWDVAHGAERAEDDVMAFYQRVRDARQHFGAPEGPGPRFLDFLDSLNRELPYGRLGQRLEVVPRAGRNWHDALLSDVLVEMRKELRSRLLATADTVEDVEGIPAYERPAFEPVFAAELAAMLEAIRTVYAAPTPSASAR